MGRLYYREYRERRQAEFNALPIFFAFGKEQFKKAMEERGLTENDTDKVYALSGGAGGLYLRKDAQIIRDYFSKPDELPELMKDLEFAEDAFYEEMCNHEYGINWQGDGEVCSCFGYVDYEEGENGTGYLRKMGFSGDVVGAYLRAKRRYYKAAEENEWF